MYRMLYWRVSVGVYEIFSRSLVIGLQVLHSTFTAKTGGLATIRRLQMHSQLAQRLLRNPLTSLPPPQSSPDYSQTHGNLAAHILYRNPLPSKSGLPVFILDAAAFPDAKEVDYDSLLPYVLARLPGEEELIEGPGYEVVFLAGVEDEDSITARKARPGWGWYVQAYHVLTRATRKRLQKLYIVHERPWVRILVEMFSTIVSPKFRRKIFHVSTFKDLALHIPLEDLLLPPSAYLHDRRQSPDIHATTVTDGRAFGAKQPYPMSINGEQRLPRVLRETTSFVLMEENIKTEGLFRIPPHNRLLGILREAYDRGQKFILWKDGNTVFSAPKVGNLDDYGVIEELDLKKGYGVPFATGLIKLWYRELSEPIFTQSTYEELERLFGKNDATISVEQLAGFIGFNSKWSPVSLNSRMILATHLLPMLSEVAAYEQYNKMTAFNLAVCFAPALVRGPDPMQDVKIGAIVRRLLEAAITEWNHGLREACGVERAEFIASLQPPHQPEDYEDASV